jgi:hypothetical protein
VGAVAQRALEAAADRLFREPAQAIRPQQTGGTRAEDVTAGQTGVPDVKAQGGSIDGPGAVVVNGMVFISSGCPRNGGVPGNVLLAFAP